MATLGATVVFFIVSLIISAIIIYVVTKLLGEKEGIGTALLAALAGAIIYALAHFFGGPAASVSRVRRCGVPRRGGEPGRVRVHAARVWVCCRKKKVVVAGVRRII